MRFQVLLFDLDGTLTASEEGILNGLRHVFRETGREVPSDEVLRSFIGPPMPEQFRSFCGVDEEESERLTAIFRSYYGERGWRENHVYEGIPALLDRLSKAGARLAVATSKPLPMAERVLNHFGLTPFFDEIVGPTMEKQDVSKGAVVAETLRRLSLLRGERAAMIGDRFYDADGALENRIPFIGVLYGYGSREELDAVPHEHLASSVEALHAYLLSE